MGGPNNPEKLTADDLLEMQERQMDTWELPSLPRLGDRMFVPSASGAHIDPLQTIHVNDGSGRPSTGRWELYIEGFREAGDRLVDGLDPDEMSCSPGAALAYPILFCYRHSIELQIKG